MIYNLEYVLLDKLGREKKTRHHGIFATIEDVEQAKQDIIKKFDTEAVTFKVYIIEDLFSRVVQA